MAKSNRTSDKNRWISENLDRINLTVPKGRKEIIQNHAQARGESVNSFINRAINEAIVRDQEKDKREEQFAQIAAKNNRSIEDVYRAVEIGEALKILEREVPDIRKIYFDKMNENRRWQRLLDRLNLVETKAPITDISPSEQD